jgi:ABC-type phosphate transport system substrate-binding protein
MKKLTALRTLAAVVMAAASLTLATAGPAAADPPMGTVPRGCDIIGVGSSAAQYLLDALAAQFNAAHPGRGGPCVSGKTLPYAINPNTGAIGDPIVTADQCAAIARPGDSSTGIAALKMNILNPAGYFCIDFARSLQPRAPGDPSCTAASGICYVALAGDAVTWASQDGSTVVPATLSPGQLRDIYTCKITNWDKVGGADARIDVFLPQTSSETRTFFLTALGGGKKAITPGACVNSVGGIDNTLIENEGDAPQLNDPDAIVPYSIADYIAQTDHSAQCAAAAELCNYPNVPNCTPGAPFNEFGCDVHGVLQLNDISGLAPVTNTKINPAFPIEFQRTVFDVVRTSVGTSKPTADNIPNYLEPFFAAASAKPKGWVCSNDMARTDIGDYGFLFPPKSALGGPCGHAS